MTRPNPYDLAAVRKSAPSSNRRDKRIINWALQRMSRILEIWAKLDAPDREFLLDKWRCEHPDIFYEVAGRKSCPK